MTLPDGLRVHYRDEGPTDARVVVLVHGFAASLHAWEPWAERLRGEYRVLTLDLPGHGLTRAPADYRTSTAGNVAVVDEVTRRVGVERFVVAGNSMGGAVAWSYALAHPERLEGLVLVNAAGWPSEARGAGGPAVFKLLTNPAGRVLLRNLDPRPLAARGLRQAYQDERLVTQALVDRYVELARAPGHRALLTSGSGGRSTTPPQSFARIRTPTLVMVGLKDQVIPPERSRGFVGGIPGSKLVTYAEGGHVPMEQMPEESARDLRAFLQALPPVGLPDS
ncbi:alpha/beta fold hydrolase [Phenylobacterium sp.]|uniref:alpha/beta fold hydrolase n=1 Tax=Phenylobacterium sp. TaxID=1871053 RepID=UPI003983CED2